MSISRKDNTLRGARNLGSLSGSKQIQGSVNRQDKTDFAKFTLSEFSNFGITLQRLSNRASARVTLRDSQGSILNSFKGGAKSKTLNGTLAAGVYYIGIHQRQGEVKYKVKTSAAKANLGTNLNKAEGLGPLSGTYTRSGVANSTNPIGLYQFTLNDVSNLQARVSSNAITQLELIRDANNNGLIDAGETILSNTDSSSPFSSSITEDLPAGTYYARITPSSAVSAEYQLNLIATPFGGNVSPDPGNSLPLARDLGAVSGTLALRDYVGTIDPTDFYKFTLNDISSVKATLKGASKNTRLQLIYDSNNNGLVDNSEVLATDANYGSILLSSVAQDLPTGSYFIKVEPTNSDQSTNYELNLVTTPFGSNISPDPGNALQTAHEIGILTGTFSAKEYVGAVDTDDFYKFTVNSATTLQAQVAGASANTRIQLIRDSNDNGFIDSNSEVLSSDSNYSSNFVSKFTKDVKAGTYFIRIIPRDQGISTNYSFSLATAS